MHTWLLMVFMYQVCGNFSSFSKYFVVPKCVRFGCCLKLPLKLPDHYWNYQKLPLKLSKTICCNHNFVPSYACNHQQKKVIASYAFLPWGHCSQVRANFCLAFYNHAHPQQSPAKTHIGPLHKQMLQLSSKNQKNLCDIFPNFLSQWMDVMAKNNAKLTRNPVFVRQVVSGRQGMGSSSSAFFSQNNAFRPGKRWHATNVEITPPKMNERPRKRDHFKRKFHPTINSQGIC